MIPFFSMCVVRPENYQRTTGRALSVPVPAHPFPLILLLKWQLGCWYPSFSIRVGCLSSMPHMPNIFPVLTGNIHWSYPVCRHPLIPTAALITTSPHVQPWVPYGAANREMINYFQFHSRSNCSIKFSLGCEGIHFPWWLDHLSNR